MTTTTDNKQLNDKAIDIKGKKYVLVSDRILFFNSEYVNGSIITQLISTPESKMVVVQARITPDTTNPDRFFTGYSQATWGDGMVNRTAALENAETSAVGRALAMMGIGVIDSVASVDEVNKAQSQPEYDPTDDWSATEPSNLGNCKNCGAPNKWSANKNKAYCSKLCWKQ